MKSFRNEKQIKVARIHDWEGIVGVGVPISATRGIFGVNEMYLYLDHISVNIPIEIFYSISARC